MDKTNSNPDRTVTQPLQFNTRTLFVAISVASVWFALVAGFGLAGFFVAWILSGLGLLLRGLVCHRPRATITGSLLLLSSCLVAMLLPAVSVSGPAAHRNHCANNLKQIALALHLYHDKYDSFPPAYIADKNGKPMHSWRVLILPYLEENDIYKAYRFDEPWDGPNNRKLHVRLGQAFHCLSDKSSTGSTTNYFAVVGANTAWPGPTPSKQSEFSDGLNKTILLIEVANSGINWFEPRDLYVNQTAATINSKQGEGISSKHPGGVNVAFADCSVRFVPDQVPSDQLDALLTRNGGETIDLSKW